MGWGRGTGKFPSPGSRTQAWAGDTGVGSLASSWLAVSMAPPASSLPFPARKGPTAQTQGHAAAPDSATSTERTLHTAGSGNQRPSDCPGSWKPRQPAARAARSGLPCPRAGPHGRQGYIPGCLCPTPLPGGPPRSSSASCVRVSLLHKHKGPRRQARLRGQGRPAQAAAPQASVLGAEHSNCLWTRDHRVRPACHAAHQHGVAWPTAR